MKRSDLMCEIADKNEYKELITSKKYTVFGCNVTDIASRTATPPKGRYITLECCGDDEKTTLAAAELLGQMIQGRKILVAGLGNVNITSDSLGAKTLRHIPPTAHLAEADDFEELGLREIYTVETGVMGQTGIESAFQLKLLCDGIKPDMAVVIDALACSSAERLCRTIQLTDSGIAPGSGVGNNRRELNRRTLGVPVTAIGVPTVIDLDNLCDSECGDFMVAPRNIDAEISRFSRIIGRAVRKALLPTLTDREAQLLIF